MKISILKYNAGNTHSVALALKRLGVDAIITNDIEAIVTSDKVIFPGVGEASTVMPFLKERKLDILIKQLKQPTLGICLGMQLMCRYSEEGDTQALGIFNSEVKLFSATEDKIPHIGWNQIQAIDSPLNEKIHRDEYFYFVHSYYAQMSTETIATCKYSGVEFSAAFQKDNFFGVQFHPEKSGDQGAQLLKNFLAL